MKYCHNCHHITGGEPLYCDYCGRSYDVKLCPRRHVNVRTAMVCSQCGSPDLSTPQPHMPFWFAPLVAALSLLPGLVLLLISVLLSIAAINAVLYQPAQLRTLLVLSLGVAGLWLLYLPVPYIIRTAVSRMWQRHSGHEADSD
jgi:hypothetical protein